MTNKRPPTVGEVLKKDFMDPMGIGRYDLVKMLGAEASTSVRNLLKNQASLTVKMAIRLSRVFKNTPMFWLRKEVISQLYHNKNPLNEAVNANYFLNEVKRPKHGSTNFIYEILKNNGRMHLNDILDVLLTDKKYSCLPDRRNRIIWYTRVGSILGQKIRGKCENKEGFIRVGKGIYSIKRRK